MPQFNADGTPLTDITGYVIRYGTRAIDLPQSINISGPGTTSYTITGLVAGTYYFAVLTVDSTDTISTQSNVASKRVP
jgi:hypothetical protein